MIQPPNIDRLKATLSYSSDTGDFYSLVPCNSGGSPKRVGSIGTRGYVRVYFGGRYYAGHRLAWFYATGEWPDKDVDHINGIRHDNRLCNLRAATRKQNKENMTVTWSASGARGVTWCKKRKAWKAQVRHNQRQHNLGYFSDLQAAAEAAKAGRDRLFTHHTN